MRRGDLGVADILEVEAIEFLDAVDDASAVLAVDAFGGVERKSTASPRPAKLDALVLRRQEASAKDAVAGARVLASHERDEGGQVRVEGSESVAGPGAEAWPAEASKAGLQKRAARVRG